MSSQITGRRSLWVFGYMGRLVYGYTGIWVYIATIKLLTISKDIKGDGSLRIFDITFQCVD